jgi:hypothetical protein
MLKFRGQFEISRNKKGKQIDEFGHPNHYHQSNIPTVNEVDDFNAPGAADTVLQILRGQGIYWGPEARCDNDVKDYSAMFARGDKLDRIQEEARKERELRREIVLKERAEKRAAFLARPKKARRAKLDPEHRKIIRVMRARGRTKEEATAIALQLIPLE